MAWRSPGSHCPTADSASQSPKPGDKRNSEDQVTKPAPTGYRLFLDEHHQHGLERVRAHAVQPRKQPEHKRAIEVIGRRGIPVVGSLLEPPLRKQPPDVTQRVQP